MAVMIYPVQESACLDYAISVNGQPVTPDTARVSAVPFNRRWPGHQRGLEQTELINFLSLAADEPVSFEITPGEPFGNVEIRPRSLGICPEIRDGKIRFTLDKPAYFTVEPFGRNHALHIFADPMPAYRIDADDPNVIFYGPGEHDVGLITLQSGQTLYLDEGAVVYASVAAKDADNIRILGRGILDNSRNLEQILFACNAEANDMAVNNAKRRHTVQLEYCTGVEIDGITIRDSLVYNIRPIGCRDLHIANVKIIGCWRYNSDGIDMHNCENVLIENCFLRTFDDSVCIKGFDCYYEGDVEKAVREAIYHNGEVYDRFTNTVVRGCVIWNDWGKGLEIGAETRAEEICGIVFEDCDIIHVTGPALDSCNVDYADVHDITFRDIRVEYDAVIPKSRIQKNDAERYVNPDTSYAPNLICVTTTFHKEYSAGGTRRGKTRDITFRNIRLYGRQAPGLSFAGYDAGHQTRDILIENLYWNDCLLTSSEQMRFTLGDFTDNIRYRAQP